MIRSNAGLLVRNEFENNYFKKSKAGVLNLMINRKFVSSKIAGWLDSANVLCSEPVTIS